NLIGCADYKIPQVLRALGITEYDKELSYMVDNKKEIEISSKYEVEIRASQIFVLGYIKNRLNSFKSVDINDFLFNYSKKLKNIVKPYHLCRNKNY
ncbi:MAG: queuosine salvage family protein, partial [Clostridia bacterium]|nr:queuosine salvage family protein [Clostridia bacterium]